MYLKSLTLKGFKSFASATTLRFEPGITCVVGPNGSGKSNVVDAIAWVLGEQGARTLRGGQMSDVIFAGTAGKQALGRAEVSLCIDNSDQAISLPHQEITLTRTMFRGGGSEYAINGVPARLLDVVELLSDAGVGREMHVIVGQNSLDTVLSGTPLDRRGLLEEAAGVLKHRKRKEKALRKLEAMQANLVRLHDLTAEVRRQLTPLGRQADAARKAAGLQATWRDASLRVLADDLQSAQRCVAVCEAAEHDARTRREQREQELAALREREDHANQALVQVQEQARRMGEQLARAQALAERYRSVVALASERQRSAAQVLNAAPGEGNDPHRLAQEIEQAQQRYEHLQAQLAQEQQGLQQAVSEREQAEQVVRQAGRERDERARAAAAAQQARTRLAGEVAALTSRIESREQELARLEQELSQAHNQQQQTSTGGQETDAQHQQLHAQLQQAQHQLDQAKAEHAAAGQVLDQARAAQQDIAAQITAARARAQALRVALAGQAEADTLALPEQAGPPLAQLIEVDPGMEIAIGTALARVINAVTIGDGTSAAQAVQAAAEQEKSALFVLTDVADAAPAPAIPLPAGASLARHAVRAAAQAQPGVQQVVEHLLASVVIVEDFATADAVLAQLPDARVVSTQGLMRDATTASTRAQEVSVVQMRAQMAQAQQQADAAHAPLEQAQQRLAQAQEQVDRAAALVAQAQAEHQQAQAQVAALAERMRHTQRAADQAATALTRVKANRDRAGAALQADQQRLPEVQAQLEQLPNEQEMPPHLLPEALATLEQQASTARQQEMQARLSLRTTEERAQVQARRLAGAQQRASAATNAQRAFTRRRAHAHAQQQLAQQVHELAQQGQELVQRWADQAGEQAQQHEQARAQRAEQLLSLRRRWDELSAEVDKLRSDDGGGEVALAQARMRMERLQERAQEEFAVDPQVLIDEYGPHQPVPIEAALPQDDDEVAQPEQVRGEPQELPPTTGMYVRSQQDKRRRAAERALKALGTVNPLALEEFAAMQERHRFLSEQLSDLTATRKDLLQLVDEVDERVRDIFASAFADTATAFEQVFSRLFPGGEGKLVLTDPDELNVSGIEVHARPPGKKVKRLSLLSGGERSLTALAFLVALFQARPSPFYVLDEVEAALDDVNLGRLIGLLEDIRESSQLIIITHQKRTMEISDALYGVSMRGDGISAVIGQRLRDTTAA